jgi:small subunit ribosomal protein S7
MRRNSARKREVMADPLYHSQLVTKITNYVMIDGKKAVAEKIVYGALENIGNAKKGDPLELTKKALRNVTPQVEVRSRRLGGATFQVPTEVKVDRGQALAIRWIIQAATKRGEKTMAERLANELMDAAEERGGAHKKFDEIRRMAESNKAFANFRW